MRYECGDVAIWLRPVPVADIGPERPAAATPIKVTTTRVWRPAELLQSGRSMTQPAASLGKPAVSGARAALILLIVINLFNYIDRQVLAAVLPSIEKSFFPPAESASDSPAPDPGVPPLQDKSPTKQKLGYLQGAFMFSYFLFAPLFGWLADRVSRWKIIGVGVILWSLG